MKQKDIFLKSEGDCWYKRNKEGLLRIEDSQDILFFEKHLKKEHIILEIGCATGSKLNYFYNKYGCKCYGIDPSSQAIEEGKKRYPALKLSKATADNLPFSDGCFDFVIFGFCLYLVDRKLLFKTITEADRVLKNNGFLGITDFDTKVSKKRKYKHLKGVCSYKMDYTSLFLAFPEYYLVDKHSYSNSTKDFVIDPKNRVGSWLLYKNYKNAYGREEDE